MEFGVSIFGIGKKMESVIAKSNIEIQQKTNVLSIENIRHRKPPVQTPRVRHLPRSHLVARALVPTLQTTQPHTMSAQMEERLPTM